MLELVVSVTGSSVEQLRTVQMGRHANPARRFAVVALHKYTTSTHRAIGEALGMSSAQVANVLRRGATLADPFATWKERLESNL